MTGPTASQATRKPRRGDVLEVDLTSIDARGHAVGKCGQQRVQVSRGIPGSRVRVEVLKRRGDRLRARTLEVLEPGQDAVEPRCEHFGSCGGCSFQDLDYAAQLEHKRLLVERTLAAAGVNGAVVEPCLGCENPWGYRNKMDFTFGPRQWIESGKAEVEEEGLFLGLHAPGFYHKVLDVASCAIQFAEGDAILADARRLARELGLEPWDVRSHTGLLRHLVLRKGFGTGEILVGLVTSEDASERVAPWAERLLARHPEITTLVQTVNSTFSHTSLGERTRALHGPGVIRERVCGLELSVSSTSFFQTNTPQAERLFELVRAEVAAQPEDCVYDLYCGGGAISLLLAPDAREVYGFELIASAIGDARDNARRNGITNARFIEGDVARELEGDYPRPQVCVTDPPRAGMHSKVLAALVARAPRRIVYVSCNVATAAPEVLLLQGHGWRLARVQPVDLFPHTPHVECVLTLERAP